MPYAERTRIINWSALPIYDRDIVSYILAYLTSPGSQYGIELPPTLPLSWDDFPYHKISLG